MPGQKGRPSGVGQTVVPHWALTIPKPQGMVLEVAHVTLSCAFTFSIVYVALSCVRCLSSLFLKTFYTSLVTVTREALSFHDKLDHVPVA